MESHDEHIHQLITGRLAGINTPEENAYLQSLINSRDDVKLQWEEANRSFTGENLQQIDDLPWADSSALLTRSRRKRVYKAIGFTTALAACIFGAVFLLDILIQDKVPQPILDTKTGNGVKLTLANGLELDLSQSNDSIKAGGTWLNNMNNSLTYKVSKIDEDNRLNSLAVPPGVNYHLKLSDSSEIWINSASTVQFPFKFSGSTREITVQGEAYLKIAKNARKPFIVTTVLPSGEIASVEVLGTEFNVNTYSENTIKVALVNGAVRVSAADEEQVIKPGIEAVYVKGIGITVHPFDEEELLGWRRGIYHLTDFTIRDIAATLTRIYGIAIVIDNESLNKQRIVGIVDRNKPITVFLDHLKQVIKIDYHFSQDSILHIQ